jgi:formyltetrahydrofolate deformylase
MNESQHFERRGILSLSCPDRQGIVAAVASFLAEQDCNILESAQFDDEISGHFFMRTVFGAGEATPDLDSLSGAFRAIARRFDMDWQIHDEMARPKVAILVSRTGHCLNDLLYRVKTGGLAMDVVAAISNHPDQKALADFYGVPYHHLPVTRETKPEQEAAWLRIVEETGAELVVLARYMQVLTPETCLRLAGRAINIHHSFLPGFKGARPYRQAHARGVKLIGATAHYVTADLDEGPIIEQETTRVSHAHTPVALERLGRDLECLVLARAVRCHIERRTVLHGSRTVVFG